MSSSNQRGVAMLMALITMTLLGVLAAQLVYDTEIYHRIVFNNIDKLRSRYLAKSALKLGLLQIHAANKARQKAQSLGAGAIAEETLEMIWQTPIIFPAPAPPDADGFEKRAIEEFNKSLGLNGRLAVTIEGQSNKLNLNEMVWTETQTNPPSTLPPSPQEGAPEEQLKKKLENRRKAFADLLQQILENQKSTDENFDKKYSGLNAETLIKNIVAWIDPDTAEDGENRPKEEYYRTLTPPYKPKNAPLFSMSEIYMVKGFDDELAKILYENFDAAITEGIHLNSASRSLLRGLIPTLTDKDLDAIMERRNKGELFKDAEAFWKFLEEMGGDYSDIKKELNEKGIRFTTKETSFRVSISASSGQSSRSWLAMVGAFPPELKIPTPTTPPVSPPPPTTPKTDTEQKADDTKAPNKLYLKAD